MFARRRLSKLARSSVVLHTADRKSFAGVVVGVYADAVALAHARLLNEDGNALPLEGELVVPLANVSFLQDGVPIDGSKAAP